jgi:signal transduction histidine kinase
MIKSRLQRNRSGANAEKSPNFGIRIILLVLLALAPIYALVIYGYREQLALNEGESESDALRMVRIVTSDQQNVIQQTEHILELLAALYKSQAASGLSCDNVLTGLVKNYEYYAEVGVADANGGIICSSAGNLGPRSAASGMWFKRVVESRDFSIGDFHIDKALNKSVLTLAYPVQENNRAKVKRVLFASIDLNWLNKLASDAELPSDAAMLVIDSDGTVLVHYPDPANWVGKRIVDGAFLEKIHAHDNGEAFAEIPQLDSGGAHDIYAFKTLHEAAEAHVFVAVGFRKSALLSGANRAFARNMASLAAMTLISLGLAWFVGRRLVVERIRDMQELYRLKSEFIALASHQLRTPLASMRLASELLASEKFGPLGDEQKDFAKTALESTVRMSSLVNDLLNNARIESGRLTIKPEPTDLLAVAKNAADELAIIAGSVRISFDFPKDLPRISVDPVLFKQVLVNLISNAIKYTSNGGSVLISIKREEAAILFSVSDTGMGIPEQEKSRIFERFFRASNNPVTAGNEGSGLGLYFAKVFVEMCGGSIGFSSETGKGSTFWFTVPITGCKAKEGEARLSAR